MVHRCSKTNWENHRYILRTKPAAGQQPQLGQRLERSTRPFFAAGKGASSR
jgi:hypothetical protein